MGEEKFVALRYQRQNLYGEGAGVKTHEGLDPLTGLPVLIYEFAGKPDPALSDLESENIPGVLDTLEEGGQGQVVVAYSRGYTPAAKPLGMPSRVFLLESAHRASRASPTREHVRIARPQPRCHRVARVPRRGTHGIPIATALNQDVGEALMVRCAQRNPLDRSACLLFGAAQQRPRIWPPDRPLHQC